MQTAFSPPEVRAKSSPSAGQAISVAVHAAVLLVTLGVLHRAIKIAPYKLPGTANGLHVLAYFSPGSPAHAQSDVASTKPAPQKTKSTPHSALSAPVPPPPQPPSTEIGTQNAVLSGIGEGDISIAMQKYFPYPVPDLSTLPHGTHGDVILTAVIDQNGKISDLKVLQGLGPAIDDAVIATVKQWYYTPATKHGVPVPSEQELHFHYERS
jgi:periplasmic protein TonB